MFRSGTTVFNSAKFALVIGDAEFSFADAVTTRSDQFAWDSSGLSWSTGDSIPVKLVRTAYVEPPSRPKVTTEEASYETRLDGGAGTSDRVAVVADRISQ